MNDDALWNELDEIRMKIISLMKEIEKREDK